MLPFFPFPKNDETVFQVVCLAAKMTITFFLRSLSLSMLGQVLKETTLSIYNFDKNNFNFAVDSLNPKGIDLFSHLWRRNSLSFVLEPKQKECVNL